MSAWYRFEFWEGYDGQKSGLTEEKAETAGTAPEQKPPAETGGGWHMVTKGETLWGIARRYGLSLTEIIARNPQVKNPNLILAGERIRVK